MPQPATRNGIIWSQSRAVTGPAGGGGDAVAETQGGSSFPLGKQLLRRDGNLPTRQQSCSAAAAVSPLTRPRLPLEPVRLSHCVWGWPQPPLGSWARGERSESDPAARPQGSGSGPELGACSLQTPPASDSAVPTLLHCPSHPYACYLLWSCFPSPSPSPGGLLAPSKFPGSVAYHVCRPWLQSGSAAAGRSPVGASG